MEQQEPDELAREDGRLQADIDRCLRACPIEGVSAIRLTGGAEVTDLSLLSEVIVVLDRSGERMEFMFATPEWIQEALKFDYSDVGAPVNTGIYTTGVPMIAVSSISGERIVMGVRRYLELQ